MTAPEGVAARLDELERLHAAALTLRKGYPSLPRLRQHGLDVEAHWSDGAEMTVAECDEDDLVALIVAAVNAMPDLIAAVRAVVMVAGSLRTVADVYQHAAPGSYDAGVRTTCEATVARIDHALSALSGRDDHTEEAGR